MDHLTADDLLSGPAHKGNRPLLMTVANTAPPWPEGTPDFVARHPRFQQLNDYLVAKAPDGFLPGRQHVDPTDIPNLLSVLSVVDVEWVAGRLRLRYRLIGTTCTEAMGRDVTGAYIEPDHLTDCGEAIGAQMAEIIKARQPGYAEFSVAMPGREHRGYQRVYFPLARNGTDVDMLMGVHAFQFEANRRRVLF